MQTQTSVMLPLHRRLGLYLPERYPVAKNGLLVAMLVWASLPGAIRETGFQSGFLIAWAVVFGLFFLVRVFDEHKDAVTDARFRRELPVPRGLVTLGELRRVAGAVFAVIIGIQLLWKPALLAWFALPFVYLLLMAREFFIVAWLRRRLLWYAVSHMLLLPLIAVYICSFARSPLDGFDNTQGFRLVTVYGAGFIVEIGRKIRAPKDERPGVETYSAVLGYRAACTLWMGLLVFTGITGLLLLHGWLVQLTLSAGLAGCITTGFRFWLQPTTARAKAIEIVSGIWALLLFLLIGIALHFG